ncbi:MAG: zinc-finger domain-containing protein [Steroidobacteraceae bacterium]
MNAAASRTTPVDPAAFEPRIVTAADLPLSCPMAGADLWNAHPRVYLPIEKTGRAKCPYCSAEYVLQR